MKRRAARGGKTSKFKKKTKPKAQGAACIHCEKRLKTDERAIFVEEELGRVFCSEDCIIHYFQPEIQALEQEYTQLAQNDDLSSEERSNLSGLRWRTLSDPQEIWRRQVETGDYVYTLISEYSWSNRKVWNVCISLFLRGEPSFLFLAFTTQNPDLAQFYRSGERIQRTYMESQAATEGDLPTDQLADPWTEDETMRARLSGRRSEIDIPKEDFIRFQHHFDETLQSPDEVWSIHMASRGGLKLFHFIKHYAFEDSYYYVVVARETEDPEQIEVLEAFPTRDDTYLQQYRCGTQELGTEQQEPASRMVH